MPQSGSKCSVLNRSQRSQRGSLRLRQSLHAADIEALVGPVSPQRPQMLPAREIPHLDRAIIPATDQPLAIWAALERQDRPLMGLSHPHTLPALQVPPAQHAIAAATQQHCTGRTPSQRAHNLARLVQGVQALPAAHIPDKEFPTASSAPIGARPIRYYGQKQYFCPHRSAGNRSSFQDQPTSKTPVASDEGVCASAARNVDESAPNS